jgi:ABC-type branched-subunit amino acid transport system substrate-binding protein
MMRVLLQAFTVAAALAALPGLASAADTLKIGMVAPFSGPASPGAQAMLKSYKYVLDDINGSGGIEIDGEMKKVELVLGDSQSKPDVGVSAGQKLLTRDNVDLLVGDMVHSDVTLALMDTVSSFDKVMFTGGATSLDIAKRIAADPKKYANVWKFNFSSDAYAGTIASTIELILAKSPKVPSTVALVAEDTGFTRPIIDVMTEQLKTKGIVLVDSEMVPIGATDFYPQIAKIREANPGFLLSIFTAPNSAVALTKQIAEQELQAVHIGLVGPAQDGFVEATGKASDGVVFVPMLYDPLHNPEHKAFQQKLAAYVGKPDIGIDYLTGYANACVLMDVLKRAKSTSPAALDKAFLETDVKCLYARWKFDPKTHQPQYGEALLALPAGQVQDGKLYAIWPKAMATAEYKPVSK